ncbi:hypothetical protein [Nannocystis pusilla]|uniref:Uncharacterized protein n=1 Tax=Nannocystis pusilla TaxID=889268 RepID=A0ABS7U3H1_9BACT|nr:hypothetical protein [Nannocystis pusilla]MBZ5715095.1 hypothetical protein [Nannocystis pusilla]
MTDTNAGAAPPPAEHPVAARPDRDADLASHRDRDASPADARDAAPSDAPPARRESSVWPWLVGLVLLGLSLSPMLRPLGYDSFPFSSFPMFAHGRKDAVTSVHRALAVLPDGTPVALPPRALGSDEVLQADATLRHAIRGGKKASARLCRAVARRVAGDPALATAVAVELVTERHDAIAWFAGERTPLSPPRRRARCKLPK